MMNNVLHFVFIVFRHAYHINQALREVRNSDVVEAYRSSDFAIYVHLVKVAENFQKSLGKLILLIQNINFVKAT